MKAGLVHLHPETRVRKLIFLPVILLGFTQYLIAQPLIPVITAVLPAKGPVGSVVTIKGANFDAAKSNDTVFFGGVKAYVISATAGVLTVSVPTGAVYGPISVTVHGLTVFSEPFVTVFTSGGDVDSTSLGAPASFGVGSYTSTLATADFDGDGKSDLAAVVGDSDQVAVLRNTGRGSVINFASPVTFGTGVAPFCIATADFNGDGKPDLAVTNQHSGTVSVLQNSSVPGTIAFRSKIDLATDTLPLNIVTADLDGDGKVDMVIATDTGLVSVFRNTTDSVISFSAKMDINAGRGPAVILPGDLDGDGRPDLVVCDPVSNQFLVFKNTSTPGSISFAAAVNYPAGAYPGCAAMADLDGDGKPELIIGNSNANNLFIFRNLSTPGVISLATADTLAAGGQPLCISISDVNGDGKPDITLADASSNAAGVLQNRSSAGSLSFAPFVLFPAGTGPESIVAGDFDGDGRPDMALADYGGSAASSLSVLQNKMNQIRYPSVNSFMPDSGGVGATITIHGVYLTGATAVTFGGVAAASYRVISDTVITAVVDSGASGVVGVVTPFGPASRGGFRYIYPVRDTTGTTPPSDTTGTTPPDSTGTAPPDSTGTPPHDSVGSRSPVPGFQLLGFTGVAQGGQVLLQWRVSHDSSVSYYVVQYSPDSVRFDGIGSVRALGEDTASYSLTDPAHAAAVSYYRLKIEDTAGVSFSRVVGVRAVDVPEMVIIFPNPANDMVTAEVPLTVNNSVFELVDMRGNVVANLPVKAGVVQVQIDVRMLNRGVYKLIWSDGVNKAFGSLLVMRK